MESRQHMCIFYGYSAELLLEVTSRLISKLDRVYECCKMKMLAEWLMLISI